MKKVLVIAPHQDDEIIGAGGLICHMLSIGNSVEVCHVFSGTSGIMDVDDPAESARIRHDEARAAAKLGGYNLLDNLGFTDRDRTGYAGVQDALIRLIRQQRPDIIVLPHEAESDAEHHLVSACGTQASWLSASNIFNELGSPLHKTLEVLYYEVWQPIKKPDYVLDISEYADMKQQLLECFPSQMKSTSWVEGALGLNAYRGTTLQTKGYAEVYETATTDLKRILT